MGLRATSKTTLRSILRLLAFLLIVVGIPAALTVFGQSSPPPTEQPPKANAGSAQTVSVGSTVFLDGSASSDINGDLLSFNWTLITQPEGSAVVLSNPTSVMSSFEVDEPGTYIAQLIVNDGQGDSTPAMVVLTTDNSTPVANAGVNQQVFIGDTVSLDGSGSSDVDGDRLQFTWKLNSKPEGSRAILSDPNAITPSFEVDQLGTYLAELIVNDANLESHPSAVTITTENSRPVADAGHDQSVKVGDLVVVDGSRSSDADEDTLLTYSWSLIAVPLGSAVELSDRISPNPNFSPDLPGTYVAQLIVSDGVINSKPSKVVISTTNSRPIADAGPDQTATVGNTVVLDGRNSFDIDGSPLTYHWSLLQQPNSDAVELSDPTSANPSIILSTPGVYLAQLIVSDGQLKSNPDTVTIKVPSARVPETTGGDPRLLQREAPLTTSAENLSAASGSFTQGITKYSDKSVNPLSVPPGVLRQAVSADVVTPACPTGTNLIISGRLVSKDVACTDDFFEPEITVLTQRDTQCSIGTDPGDPTIFEIPEVDDLDVGQCTYKPLRRARVSLFDRDILNQRGGPSRVTTVKTDDDGIFVICGNVGANSERDYFASVSTCADGSNDGDACGTEIGVERPFSVGVLNPQEQLYSTNSGTIPNACTGAIHWEIVDRRVNHNGAQEIYNLLANKAFDYLVDEVNFVNDDRLRVLFPSASTGFAGDTGDIFVGRDFETRDDVLLQQYGLYLQHRLNGGSLPVTGCGAKRFAEHETTTCAWIDGFGLFLQAAIQNDPNFDGVFNLEGPTPFSDHKESEGAVAATLWDIFDSQDEDWDEVSLGIGPIWESVKQQPADICEFVKAYNESPNGNPDITSILQHHLISCDSLESFDANRRFTGPSEALVLVSPSPRSLTQNDLDLLAEFEPKGLESELDKEVKAVAADGVTLLFLRLTIDSGEEGEVTFQVQSDAVESMGSLWPVGLGPESPLISGGQGNGDWEDEALPLMGKTTLSVETHKYNGDREELKGKTFAFAIYRAPRNFFEEDSGLRPIREVNISTTFTPFIPSAALNIDSEIQISIVRPPVMLVHGTFSDPGTWTKFPLWIKSAKGENGFTFPDPFTPFVTYRLSWADNNSGRLVTNAKLILPRIVDAINAFRTSPAFNDAGIKRIAVTQADVVTHSFGGPVVRRASQLEVDQDPLSLEWLNFRTYYNWGYGYIRKFISIAGTHKGSQMPGHTAKVNSQSSGALAKLGLVTPAPRIDCGATADQNVISDALRSLTQTIFPSHAIAGSSLIENGTPHEFVPFVAFQLLSCASIDPSVVFGPYCRGQFPRVLPVTLRQLVNYVFNFDHESGAQSNIVDTRPWHLGHAPNYDLTVRLPSMLGGITDQLSSLTGNPNGPFTDIYNMDPFNPPSDSLVGKISHIFETSSLDVSLKVEDLLLQSTQSSYFSRFPAVTNEIFDAHDLDMISEFPQEVVEDQLRIGGLRQTCPQSFFEKVFP
ncbi:MAG: hypothetical protein NPIRA05_00200 [Nitrospirales bacterium]|nr:MAG: hypothetical protein NPIRA05_00200 [Nitrospirales bacterium]